MSSNKISVIVFDLGNVLLPFDYNIAVNKLDDIEAGLGEKFTNFYKINYQIHRAFEKGKLSEKDFVNKILNAVNYITKLRLMSFVKFIQVCLKKIKK